MRLQAVTPEYRGRVRVRLRPFPLEVDDGEAAPRDILEQEWWLAALQEPGADFAPWQGDAWPTTTLPAFEAAWCAAQQGEDAAWDYDLRVRRAFFAQSRDIGRREVLLEIAREAGLDLPAFTRLFDSGTAGALVLAERRLGREHFHVRGTPTVMLADGTRLRPPLAFPTMRARRITAVAPLPCCGESCLDATRAWFEQALEHGAPAGQIGEQPS